MEKDTQEEMKDKSKLVATVIQFGESGQRTVLITPQAKYYFVGGRLSHPERVEDYNQAVKEEIEKITVRAKKPMARTITQEDYHIQIFGF